MSTIVPDLSVSDRTILVTGASRGLGRAMALGLLREGAKVIFASKGPSAALDATVRSAQNCAPEHRFAVVSGDIACYDDCARICEEATSVFGPLDVLINNAAIPMVGEGPNFWEMNPQDWSSMTQINCDAVFYMCRAATPGMIEHGSGKIINISTSERTMVRARFSPYGPSKTFIEACSRIWAEELKGTGVTVNVLSPGGVVDTASDITGMPTLGKSFLPASVMIPPTLWLSSAASNGVSGERYVASLWKEDFPLTERIASSRQCGVEMPHIM